MAAELIMPTLPGDQQQSRHFLPPSRPLHTRSQSYQVSSGPQISPLNTAHADMMANQTCSTPPSPTGSGSGFRNGGGRPMYMPAVLRRCDEFPSRKVTRCKTASSTSSTDSDSTLRLGNSAILNLPGLSAIGNRLSRRSTGESSKTLEGEWNADAYPQVTGQPSRTHWKVSFILSNKPFICNLSSGSTGYAAILKTNSCTCSPILNLPSATTQPASGPSTTLYEDTTAESAATSSAIGTPILPFLWIRMATSTRALELRAPATTASRRPRLCIVGETARAPVLLRRVPRRRLILL